MTCTDTWACACGGAVRTSTCRACTRESSTAPTIHATRRVSFMSLTPRSVGVNPIPAAGSRCERAAKQQPVTSTRNTGNSQPCVRIRSIPIVPNVPTRNGRIMRSCTSRRQHSSMLVDATVSFASFAASFSPARRVRRPGPPLAPATPQPSAAAPRAATRHSRLGAAGARPRARRQRVSRRHRRRRHADARHRAIRRRPSRLGAEPRAERSHAVGSRVADAKSSA